MSLRRLLKLASRRLPATVNGVSPIENQLRSIRFATMGRKTKSGLSLSEKREREKLKKKNKLTARQSEADQIAVPDSGQVDVLVGYYQRQELDKARQLAAHLSETFPQHPLAWRILSAVAHQEGRIADSLAFQERVIDLSPSDAEAHFNMGILLKA